jgi:hypothetical protein
MKKLNNFHLIVLSYLIVLFGCKKDETITDKSYSPSSAGSKWSYDGVIVEGTFNEMTGKTSKKFNKTYFEKRVSTATNQYFYYGTRIGNNYYTVVSAPNDINLENEILYLKSDASIDETWVNDIKYGYDVLGSQWTFKMIEKGITKVVNGKSYSDVIHTRRYSDGLTVDSYYSLGIGLIEVDYNNGGRSTLIDYNIK